MKRTLFWMLVLLPLMRETPAFTQVEEGMLPPNTLVITAAELRDGVYSYDLFDVLAALRILPGITVKSSSDIGAEDWLLIRGLPRDSARNVLVLIDGMPLNNALNEGNEFEHLPPIELIDRIIVYKPPLPARFGSYHAAIEVITKGQAEEMHGEAAGAYGQAQSGFGSAYVEGAWRGLSYRGIFDYLRTDNLTGERRTPPKQDQVYSDRSYWRATPVGKLIYQKENYGFFLYAQYLDSKKDFSTEVFRGKTEFRERSLTAFNLSSWVTPWEDSTVRFNLFRADGDDELNLMMHPDVQNQDRYKQGVRVSWTSPFLWKQRLSVGGDFTDIHAVERGEAASLQTLRDTDFYGLYIEDQIQPFASVAVNVGLRFDDHSEATSCWNPSVSATYQPFQPTTLYGLWGRSARWPALDEFNAQDPLRRLRSETLEGVEFGIRQEIIRRRLSGRVALFRLELEDEAQFVMDMAEMPPFIGYRTQGDTLRSRGVETEVSFLLIPGLTGFLNYTFDEAVRRPSGRPVDFGGPKHLFNWGFAYMQEWGGISLFGRYGGKAKGIQAMGGSPTELDDWFVVDLAGFYRMGRHLEYFFRASNLLDEKFETFDGRPMFGRVVIGGVALKF